MVFGYQYPTALSFHGVMFSFCCLCVWIGRVFNREWKKDVACILTYDSL